MMATLRHTSRSVVPMCGSTPGSSTGTSSPGTMPPMSATCWAAKPSALISPAASLSTACATAGSYWLRCRPSGGSMVRRWSPPLVAKDGFPIMNGEILTAAFAEQIKVHTHRRRQRHCCVAGRMPAGAVDAHAPHVPPQEHIRAAVGRQRPDERGYLLQRALWVHPHG